MTSTYGVRELYGGAMTVELPVDLIDSSDIRQIPDHQEVFLSPTTLTSVIFEIDDYVPANVSQPSPSPGPTTTTSTTTAPDGTTTTTTTTAVTQTIVNGTAAAPQRSREELDAEAAKVHFTDVISPPDTLASPLPNPQPVQMADPSLAGHPAYMLAGNINSHEIARQPTTTTPSLPTAGSTSSSSPSATSSSSSSAQHLTSLVHQFLLLIRLPSYSTDVCVRINVPVKEFVEAGQRLGSSSDSPATQAMILDEVTHARDVFAHIVRSLTIRDFSLFNA
ncbi:hypothetical protein AYO20_01994 [Fonsecaea nubica]|uniref:Uncharacterized protein n=1 Tax=Fonsecaea nubica TaxID=856822 RepID=A0A178D9Q0_9EURO|nr:hypothetical protein AYO20_01994 [Fonsecaea nubica]OAL38788.1 hypothetical protein AYO20_01994 [Fonsecaea nubica]